MPCMTMYNCTLCLEWLGIWDIYTLLKLVSPENESWATLMFASLFNVYQLSHLLLKL